MRGQGLGGVYRIFGPVLRLLPAEAAHRATIAALRLGLVWARPVPDDPILGVRVWGRAFSNPVGLAAGFDKDAEAVDALLGFGFGFVEVGTVTPRPQSGNPRPRVFRLAADRAVINRLGFNSQGLARVAARLRARRADPRRTPGIVGANLGPNRDSDDPAADCAEGVAALAGLADYLVVNVSSPNTPGLRALQGRDELAHLVGWVQAARTAAAAGEGAEAPGGGEAEAGAKAEAGAQPEGGTGARARVGPPILVKIAPDLTEEDMRDIAEVALEAGIDGLIVSNTTVGRPDGLRSRHRDEAGGLSGEPLFGPSTEVLREMYRRTGGRVPLVGVGGISSGRHAYVKIRAGASLVQLYTALIYEGPGLIGRIKAELADLLRADGFTTLAEAVGADHR